ncbi:MAG: GNAT family N-acetyltransferase [Acidimicrobiales bacterium]
MPALRWSPPTRDDDPAWVALLAAIEAVDQRGEVFALEDLDDEWASVNARPSTDATFVWDGDDLVAFGWLRSMPGAREHHRVWCWGGVHPDRRGEGIGRQVLAWQLAQGSAVAGRLDPSLPTDVQVEAVDTMDDLARLARRLGFEPVRRFLEVARPTEQPVEVASPPSEVAVGPWDADVDEAVRVAHGAAFADHWGSEPPSAEEWAQWHTGHRAFRPDLSFVAREAATGAVASYVLCSAYPQDWEAVGHREVWVQSIGTDRAWRGRGVGRAVLTTALSAAAEAADGFERVILGVDADNPTGALALYRSLAFDDVRATTTFSRQPT